MSLVIGSLILIVTITMMEAVAYATHRWVMHGPGWGLHRSHHRPRHGSFEANDLYALIFALPSILLLFGGINLGWGDWAFWIGAGIASYGAIYFGFHDVIVHQRVAHSYVARSTYMKRIVQAHRLHHVITTRDGAVSFGFIWAQKPRVLKAQLAAQRKKLLAEPDYVETLARTSTHARPTR